MSLKFIEFEAKLPISKTKDSVTQTSDLISVDCQSVPKHNGSVIPLSTEDSEFDQEQTRLNITTSNRFDVLSETLKSLPNSSPDTLVPAHRMSARPRRTPLDKGQEYNAASTSSRQIRNIRKKEAPLNVSDLTIITDGQLGNSIKRSLFKRKCVYLKTLSNWGTYPEARAYIKGAKHEAKNVLFFLGSQDLQYKPATVVGEAVSNLVAETKRVWPNVNVILSTVLPSKSIIERERRTLNDFVRCLVSRNADVHLVDLANDVNFVDEHGKLERSIKSVVAPIL